MEHVNELITHKDSVSASFPETESREGQSTADEDIRLVINLQEPEPKVIRSGQFLGSMNEQSLAKSTRGSSQFISTRQQNKLDKERLKIKESEITKRKKEQRLKDEGKEKERDIKSPGTSLKTYDEEDPRNHHRLLICNLCSRFSEIEKNDRKVLDAFRESLSEVEMNALSTHVKSWSLLKGFNFKHRSLKGHTAETKKLNEKRQEILSAFGFNPKPKVMKGLEKEIKLMPFLARHLEAAERVSKQNLIDPSINFVSLPDQPRQQTANTFLPFSGICWETIPSQNIPLPFRHEVSNDYVGPFAEDRVQTQLNKRKSKARTKRKLENQPTHSLNKKSILTPSNEASISRPESPTCLNDTNFMDIIPLDGLDNTRSTRVQAYELFLPDKGYLFKLSQPAITWKCFKQDLDKHMSSLSESQLDKVNFFLKSQLTQDQIRSIQYYNLETSRDTPNYQLGSNQQLIKPVNIRIKHLIYSIGISTIYIVMQQLQSVESHLWHASFIQKFMDVMTESLRIGIKVPKYPSPPANWILNNHDEMIEKSIEENLVFFDEIDFDEQFRGLILSWTFVQGKKLDEALEKSVMGIKLNYNDLSTLFPIQNYQLSNSILIAIVRCLLMNANGVINENGIDVKIRGIKEFTVPLSIVDDLKFYTNKKEKTANDIQHLLKLENDIAYLKNLYRVMSKRYDFIVIIHWQPFNSILQYSVIVKMSYDTGDFQVLSPIKRLETTDFLNKWSPLRERTEFSSKSSLHYKLIKLQSLAELILPREGGWKRSSTKQEWPCWTKIQNINEVGVIKDEDYSNYNLFLCMYVDYLVSGTTENGLYVPWLVSQLRSNAYEIADAPEPLIVPHSSYSEDVQLLIKYTQNFRLFRPNEHTIEIPNELISKMFNQNAFYSWSFGWLKLRYFELLRSKM